MRLEVVTPEKMVVDAEVDSVTVPTATGEAGIMPNHAPLISALKPGILSYSAKGSTEKLVIAGGFVEVNAQMVSVLADSAESSDEIDAATAKADRDDAERSLSAAGPLTAEESEAAREIVDLANARMQISSK